jgi:predicted nucleic acid-binding protein
MKLFLDANVLVSVVNKEYPLFTYSAKLLSLADSGKYMIYTSPVCLAIVFYFAGKKSGIKTARSKIDLLASKIEIADIGEREVRLVFQNKSIEDFEDGLEYYAAKNAGCDCIVTEDTDDFYFSEIPVMNSKSFLEQYVKSS